MAQRIPQPPTDRHFGRSNGEWVCLHPDDAPNGYYLTLTVFQGKSEMDCITLRQAAARAGVRYAIAEAAFSKPAPKPGDFKPPKAKKEAKKGD